MKYEEEAAKFFEIGMYFLAKWFEEWLKEFYEAINDE